MSPTIFFGGHVDGEAKFEEFSTFKYSIKGEIVGTDTVPGKSMTQLELAIDEANCLRRRKYPDK